MFTYISIPEILLSIALLSSGSVLFLVIRKVIEQLNLFRGRLAGILAFSLSCLIVASIAMVLLAPGSSVENEQDRLRVNFFLLPGVAVAGTILLLQLFIIAATTMSDRDNKGPVQECDHESMKPNSLRRATKEKIKHQPSIQKSGGKSKSDAKTNSSVEGMATA